MKNDEIDLCLADREAAITVLFEAKADNDQYSIYTALGQLQYHSAGFPTARRILVVPSLTATQRFHLNQLKWVEVVTYTRVNDRYVFQGLKLPKASETPRK